MAMNAPMSAPDEPSAPGRLARLVRPALWRSAARGVAAVLVAAAIVAPLTSLGWTMLAIFAAITVGLNLGLWAGRDSMLASLAGAVLLPVVGLVIALTADVQIMGSNAGTIALHDIARFPYAARFRFTDARVATEFATASDPRLPAGDAPRGGWRVAPLVPDNWTPAHPVPAWAVARVSGYGPLDFRTPRSWQQQSYRAGVRYVSTAFSPADKAVARALARYDLTAAPNAPLLYWVEEPQSVIADERTFLAWVMFGGVATWLFFLIGEALLVPLSAPSDGEPGPPRRRERAAPLAQSAEGGAA
jgi:hypothetical protein